MASDRGLPCLNFQFMFPKCRQKKKGCTGETLVYGSLPSFPNDCRKIRIIVGVWNVIGLLLFAVLKVHLSPIRFHFALFGLCLMSPFSFLHFPRVFLLSFSLHAQSLRCISPLGKNAFPTLFLLFCSHLIISFALILSAHRLSPKAFGGGFFSFSFLEEQDTIYGHDIMLSYLVFKPRKNLFMWHCEVFFSWVMVYFLCFLHLVASR